MPITEQEIQTVKEIVLNGARAHFPPSVQFHDANVTVRLDAYEEEFFDVELLYTAPSLVLDGKLMSTFLRVIDEPILAAGVTAHTLVGYTEINDPTRRENRKSPTPAAGAR